MYNYWFSSSADGTTTDRKVEKPNRFKLCWNDLGLLLSQLYFHSPLKQLVLFSSKSSGRIFQLLSLNLPSNSGLFTPVNGCCPQRHHHISHWLDSCLCRSLRPVFVCLCRHDSFFSLAGLMEKQAHFGLFSSMSPHWSPLKKKKFLFFISWWVGVFSYSHQVSAVLFLPQPAILIKDHVKECCYKCCLPHKITWQAHTQLFPVWLSLVQGMCTVMLGLLDCVLQGCCWSHPNHSFIVFI